MKTFVVQKNITFGIDDDAWIDCLAHRTKLLARTHMSVIANEHKYFQGDNLMLGQGDTKGLLLALSPDGSQVAYRIHARLPNAVLPA
jgi:hypothetical protein